MVKKTRKIGDALRMAYFGSPDFSADLLQEILTKAKSYTQVCLVVTQPDKPAGRGMTITQTPVKTVAQKYCIPVYEEPLRSSTKHLEMLLHENMIDVALVYAFNEIIPESVLSIPSLGFWNIHPSLLPKYRGASPIAFPLALHEDKTGVSLMQMVRRMDAGPIVKQKGMVIEGAATQVDLQQKLTSYGFDLLLETFQTMKDQLAVPTLHQCEENATYTFKLNRQDGYIPLTDLKKLVNGDSIPTNTIRLYERYIEKNPSHKLVISMKINEFFDLWRGLVPWPGVWTHIPTIYGEKRLKIIHMTRNDGTTRIEKVQIEGKNVVSFDMFLKGYPHVFN